MTSIRGKLKETDLLGPTAKGREKKAHISVGARQEKKITAQSWLKESRHGGGKTLIDAPTRTKLKKGSINIG